MTLQYEIEKISNGFMITDLSIQGRLLAKDRKEKIYLATLKEVIDWIREDTINMRIRDLKKEGLI